MTKTELITQVAEKSGLTKKDSAVALEAFQDAVAAALAAGDDLTLTGFGTFAV